MGLVEFVKYYDSLSAGAAQSLLTSEGLESHIFDMGMTLQAVGFAIPIRLMVDEDDLEEARAILGAAGDAP
jgi:hypothetical protein